MSKFFRSANSSGSESSSDDDGNNEEHLSNSMSELSVSQHTQSEDARDPGDALALERPRNGSAQLGRDMLLHALLEERCMNQVLEARRRQGRNVDDHDAIQRQARELYQQTSAQLAPLNLVSTGLDHDRHMSTRQTVRDGLDRIAMPILSSSLGTTRPAFPAPLRRLLTASTHSSTEPGSPASLFDSVANTSIMPSRYIQDFEEIGVLGRGGFGEVYQVRHKLDDCIYAVKKVPIRQSLMARIASEGQAALDQLLSEVRSLSRLQHPNVVRYFNSWIEWSVGGRQGTSSNTFVATDDNIDAVGGADTSQFSSKSRSFDSLERVRTQSDTDELAITFEASTGISSRQEFSSRRFEFSMTDHASRGISGSSVLEASNGITLSTTQPTLALHMQMSVHPMTLVDFLSPPSSTDTSVAPLSHCFHLDPSLRILLSLLDGVEYLHSENIVHRDLKPANIFLRHENNPRVAKDCVDLFLCADCRSHGTASPAKLSVCIGDFGLVTQLASDSESHTGPEAAAVGTEIYRPMGNTASTTSPHLDIFALGIIACELLCKFNTQMERRDTLQSVRRGSLPKRLASGNHSSRVQDCIASMLGEEAAIDEIRKKIKTMLAYATDNGSLPGPRRSST